MNQATAVQAKKPTPWITALYSLSAPVTVIAYFGWKIPYLLEKAKDGVSNEKLTADFLGDFWLGMPVLITALIAGILNFIFVSRGGKKWTLILSILGFLLAIGAILFLGNLWMASRTKA
jgi:hypothetical protein